MKTPYSLDEVFDIAEQVERSGATFYRKAAVFVRSEEVRLLLLSLADQEMRHEEALAQMRKDLPPEGVDVVASDEDTTLALYLRSLAGLFVFDMKHTWSNPLPSQASTEDVLRIAIEKEKSSIVLYLGIIDAERREESKKKIEGILREERKHLADLSASLLSVVRTEG